MPGQKILQELSLRLLIKNNDALDLVALPDHINHINTVCHFAEHGVFAVEVGGVLAAMADEKLRTT